MKFFNKAEVCRQLRRSDFGSGGDFLPRPDRISLGGLTGRHQPPMPAPEHRMRVGAEFLPRSNSGGELREALGNAEVPEL